MDEEPSRLHQGPGDDPVMKDEDYHRARKWINGNFRESIDLLALCSWAIVTEHVSPKNWGWLDMALDVAVARKAIDDPR